jgi:hypothetical protein
MSIKVHIINAIASAAVIGMASALVDLKVNDARQDQRIQRLEGLDASVNGLRTDIQTLDSHLYLLDGKVQRDEQFQDNTHK